MKIELNLEYFMEIKKINYYLKSNYQLKDYVEQKNLIIGTIEVSIDFFNSEEEFENKTQSFTFNIEKEPTTKLENLNLDNLSLSVIDNQGVQIYYLVSLEVDKVSTYLNEEKKNVEKIMKNEYLDENEIEEDFIQETEKKVLEEIKQNIALEVNNTLEEVLRPKMSVKNDRKESYIDLLKDKSDRMIVKYIKDERDIEKISNQFKVPLEDLYRNVCEKKVKVVIINDRKD